MLGCEVDGAILTSEFNEMLRCRRTNSNITKTGNYFNADAVFVFGVEIDLTGE